jgi:hypothetical protein
MTSHDRLFLIVFDRAANVSDVTDLGHDAGAALESLRRREHEFAGREDVEVVLVGSASLETLRKTHSSYFGASAGLAPELVSRRS